MQSNYLRGISQDYILKKPHKFTTLYVDIFFLRAKTIPLADQLQCSAHLYPHQFPPFLVYSLLSTLNISCEPP